VALILMRFKKVESRQEGRVKREELGVAPTELSDLQVQNSKQKRGFHHKGTKSKKFLNIRIIFVDFVASWW